MIKKSITDPKIISHLAEIAPDSNDRFMLSRGHIRGSIVHGTSLVNQMRCNHEIGILETLVLGHAFLGASLLTSSLKTQGRVILSVECGGPIKGFTVESDIFGNIRGYLAQVPIPIDRPLDSFDLSDFFGPGFMSITRHQSDNANPYTGQSMLQYGNIAQDLAHFFMISEQIPTSFILSVQFDKDGTVVGAGGLFLQVLPGADDGLLETVEEIVYRLPSLGQYFASGGKSQPLIEEAFGKFSPVLLESEPIRFECGCTKERFGAFLAALPAEDKKGILEEGPFPVKTVCHNCNSTYEFMREEIQQLFSN